MRTVQFTEERLVIFLNSIKFSGIDTGGTLEDVLNKFNEKHGNSLPAGTVFNAVRFLKDRGLLGNVQDELNFQDELKENFLNCNYVLSPAAAQGPGGAGAMAAAAAGGGGGGAAAAVAPAMAPAMAGHGGAGAMAAAAVAAGGGVAAVVDPNDYLTYEASSLVAPIVISKANGQQIEFNLHHFPRRDELPQPGVKARSVSVIFSGENGLSIPVDLFGSATSLGYVIDPREATIPHGEFYAACTFGQVKADVPVESSKYNKEKLGHQRNGIWIPNYALYSTRKGKKQSIASFDTFFDNIFRRYFSQPKKQTDERRRTNKPDQNSIKAHRRYNGQGNMGFAEGLIGQRDELNPIKGVILCLDERGGAGPNKIDIDQLRELINDNPHLKLYIYNKNEAQQRNHIVRYMDNNKAKGLLGVLGADHKDIVATIKKDFRNYDDITQEGKEQMQERQTLSDKVRDFLKLPDSKVFLETFKSLSLTEKLDCFMYAWGKEGVDRLGLEVMKVMFITGGMHEVSASDQKKCFTLLNDVVKGEMIKMLSAESTVFVEQYPILTKDLILDQFMTSDEYSRTKLIMQQGLERMRAGLNQEAKNQAVAAAAGAAAGGGAGAAAGGGSGDEESKGEEEEDEQKSAPPPPPPPAAGAAAMAVAAGGGGAAAIVGGGHRDDGDAQLAAAIAASVAPAGKIMQFSDGPIELRVVSDDFDRCMEVISKAFGLRKEEVISESRVGQDGLRGIVLPQSKGGGDDGNFDVGSYPSHSQKSVTEMGLNFRDKASRDEFYVFLGTILSKDKFYSHSDERYKTSLYFPNPEGKGVPFPDAGAEKSKRNGAPEVGLLAAAASPPPLPLAGAAAMAVAAAVPVTAEAKFLNSNQVIKDLLSCVFAVTEDGQTLLTGCAQINDRGNRVLQDAAAGNQGILRSILAMQKGQAKDLLGLQ
jgi:hypothetical protein